MKNDPHSEKPIRKVPANRRPVLSDMVAQKYTEPPKPLEFWTLVHKNYDLPKEPPIYYTGYCYSTKELAIEAAFEYAKEKQSTDIHYVPVDTANYIYHDSVRYKSHFGPFNCGTEFEKFTLKK
jgi:hypothetical protein